MKATVIVLTYNGARFLPECLASLAELPPHFQVLVVDNGSTDDSFTIARSFPNVRAVANGKNLGFSGGMNHGIRLALGMAVDEHSTAAPSDVVLLLNQDTHVLPGWAEAIVAPLADASVAAVGCKILAPNQQVILHVGGGVQLPRATTRHLGEGEIDVDQYSDIIDVEYATGAALALRGDSLRQVGLFDELFNPAYMEEVDLCARLRRAGYRIVVNPSAAVIHYEGTSTPNLHQRSYWFHRGRLLYLLKHATAAELLGAFCKAEKEFIHAQMHTTSLFVLKRAYLDALVSFAQWYQSRIDSGALPFTAQDRARIIRAFSELRNQIVERDRELFETFLNT